MKKIIAVLLVLVMAPGLAACGGADEKIILNVIAAQYSGKTSAWWADFEKDFEAANGNIDLVVDVISWNDIDAVANTRISNNDAPDILNIDVFADYQADGLLLPVEDYISGETFAKFYPTFLEQSVIDGMLWAVPDLTSARALYFNADILASAGVEVPTTWAELKSACEAIKAYDASIYPWGVDMTTDEGQACFAYYAWSNGGGFVDADGNWALNSRENVEAVAFVIDLIHSGLTNSDPTTETRYDLQEMFASGKLAMMIGPNQISSYVASTGNPIHFGIAPIPANEGKESSSVGVMDRFMVFDNDHNDIKMEAITKFFDFFYEDKRYSEWVMMEDFLPATTAGGTLMAEADPAAGAWMEIVSSAQFYPAAKAEWADVKQGVIHIQQQALTTGGDIRALLDALQAEITG